MRLRIFAAILLAPVLFGTAARAQLFNNVDSNYVNSHYTERLDFFKKMPDQKHEIVFLGNSITEGGEWQEIIPGRAVLNRGISGDVSYGVLARMDDVLSSRPDKIFLLIGINDLKRGTSAEAILSVYGRIIKQVRQQSPKTKLYIQSILPVNEQMLPQIYNKINNSIIKSLNGQLQQLCNTPEVIYVDLHPTFEDGSGQLKKDWSIDGLHLRAAAYIQWVNRLKFLKVL
ncbi:GDSL-type esterase/lipase family protein [Mucilaginibacter paludis]|uniref:Lipolytic protein G-D-S-L family n=1 Tax=Mucilaginibacter paludis DSM 18603 TaxID=714943 RepID=H1Y6N0_9SPHI|nr:GDSL-type esterase/lipase family protein [Mucilaginibacter paludis]EHQ26822.1 lipolytic protein G-D-S-L family [Mucilaginibacter paludis DSM 18603]